MTALQRFREDETVLLRKCYLVIVSVLITSLWIIGTEHVWKQARSISGSVLHFGTPHRILTPGDVIHKTWPPDDTFELFRTDFGAYSVSLKPWVNPSERIRNSKMSYIRLLKTMFNDTENNRSELEKLVHLDVHHRLNGAEQDLQLYPKVLDLRATVSAIRSGKPTDQNPESDPELLVLQAPLLSCRNLEDGLFLGRRPYNCDLMVMVKSCTLCQRQRAHARSTYMQKRLWVGLRIEFVFVVGVPFFLNSSRYIVDDVELPSRQHVRTKNELRERRKALFKESQINNDMLIGGFRDSYENLTTKVIFAFRWASTFCKYCSPLFLFMDNDVSLIPKNVLRLVKNLPEEDKKEVLGGMRYPNREAVRPTGNIFANRHALTRKHYPWRYLPPFLRGGGYLVGSEKVRDAAIASAYVKRVRMEDVFTALIWEKLGYKCIILPGFLLRPSLPSDVARLSLTYTRFADLHVDWKTGEFVH